MHFASSVWRAGFVMSGMWIEIARSPGSEQSGRHELAAGRTRLGGGDCDIDLGTPQGEELHLWTDPPKAVFVGATEVPRMNGREFDDVVLGNGDRIEWRGHDIRIGVSAPVIVEEEIEASARPPAAASATSAATGGSPPSVASAVPPSTTGIDARAWNRLRAGMLVELGLANKKVARRWQEAVKSGTFDADACAQEILEVSVPDAGDARLLERAGRLERDLLMAPVQRGVRGAGRRARGAARGGLAFLLAQLVAILVYSLIVLGALLVARAGSGRSIDAMLDGLLNFVSP